MRYNKRYNETLEDHAGQKGIHPRGGIQGPPSAGVREIDTHSLSIGLEAGNAWVATSIEDSVAIGYQSQLLNEGGLGITTLGVRAFSGITHDYASVDLIGIGVDTGGGVQTPRDEIYIGNRILSAANAGATIYGNTIVGHDVFMNTTTFNSEENIIIVRDSMQDAPMTNAFNNIVMGMNGTGNHLDTGCYNVLMGWCAGDNLSGGDYNVIIGDLAGGADNWGNGGVTTGGYNVMIGTDACNAFSSSEAITGNFNIAIGADAGMMLIGASDYNVCLGANAGPDTEGEYGNKGWIDTTRRDSPTLGFDFNESRVGFSANVSSLTNIIHVVASSATDPIADSWTTHASSRKEKEITGNPNNKKILDSIRNTEVYNYKRKVELIDAEKQRIIGQFKRAKQKANKDVKVELTEEDNVEIEKRYNAKLTGKDKLKREQKEKIKLQIINSYTKKKQNQSRHSIIFTNDDLKEIDKLHANHLQAKSNLPKFTTERLGVMIDDDNVPSEILTFDEAGNKNGIDLLAYIGYLHGAIKALTLEVDILKK